jgi:CRP-like cAMP-binding protein
MTSKLTDFATLLQINPFFSGLGPEAIQRLAALCQKRTLTAGETLFVKGDDGDALYGVRRGQIQIETGTKDGETLTLNVLGAGDLFGEIALFDGQPRTANAVASEASELFVLRRSDFLNCLQKDARLSIKVIELLCQRIRWISDRMEETALLPLNVRLARRLVILSEDFGSDIAISQERLATYVGAARETVNRQLQIWRRGGLIDLKRGRIIVTNQDRLATEAKRF